MPVYKICKIACIFFLFIVPSVYSANADKSWSFSLSFLDTLETMPLDKQSYEPHHGAITAHYDIQQEQDCQWHKAHTAINISAMLYAAINIYWHYQHHYVTPPQTTELDTGTQSSLAKALAHITPGFLHNGKVHCHFLFDCCKTTLETLLYKTIAKLILVCGQYDLVGLLARHKKRLQGINYSGACAC